MRQRAAVKTSSDGPRWLVGMSRANMDRRWSDSRIMGTRLAIGLRHQGVETVEVDKAG